MIEHWYEYLPAAWFTHEGKVWVTISIVLVVGVSFFIGYLVGRNKERFRKS